MTPDELQSRLKFQRAFVVSLDSSAKTEFFAEIAVIPGVSRSQKLGFWPFALESSLEEKNEKVAVCVGDFVYIADSVGAACVGQAQQSHALPQG